jgi:transposase
MNQTNQTLDTDQRALEAYKQTGSIFQAAATVGATVAEVREWMRGAGMPVPPPGNAKNEALRPKAEDLFSAGHTPTQVSEALGVPMGTVSRWSRDRGLSFLIDRSLQRAQAVELVRGKPKSAGAPAVAGLSIKEAARQVGVSEGLVFQWVAAAGVESPKQRARRLRPDGERMLRAGKPPSEVSAALFLPIQTTSTWKRHLVSIGDIADTPQKRHRRSLVGGSHATA